MLAGWWPLVAIVIMRMKAKSIVNRNTKINTVGYSFYVITKKRVAVTRERTVTDTKMFTFRHRKLKLPHVRSIFYEYEYSNFLHLNMQ
jgi:hypothetical protein